MSKYMFQSSRKTSTSQTIEDSKKKASLLNDKSWIRKDEEEDEDVDRDPNFGKSVLSRYKSNETLESSGGDEVKTTKTISTSSSVNALTKRFSGSQDELRSSTLPSSKSTSSYTKTTRTSVTEEPKTSTTTTTVTKDGKTTETTISSSQSLRSPVIKSPTKTDTFSERVMSSSKGSLYSNYSPTKTTKVTETTVTSDKDAENKLYDSLIPSSIKGDVSPTDSKRTISTTETRIVRSSLDTDAEDKFYDTLRSIKDDSTESKTTVTSTERVTVKSSSNGESAKSTTTTRTSSSAEDDLYGTLLPKGITSSLSSPSRNSSITKSEIVTVESSRGGGSPTLNSPSSTGRVSSYSMYSDDIPSTRTTSYTVSTKPSEDYSSERKSYSYSRPDANSYDYSSISSPTSYSSSSSSYRSSRSDDNLGDSVYSSKSVYASPERTVLEKDLCTSCRKPFTADAKMVLDDMKINCHATCFKCAVCNSSLGHLKAGDSMWIYKRMVHCENCFEVTRDKWRR